jgi:hypothetical protein
MDVSRRERRKTTPLLVTGYTARSYENVLVQAVCGSAISVAVGTASIWDAVGTIADSVAGLGTLGALIVAVIALPSNITARGAGCSASLLTTSMTGANHRGIFTIFNKNNVRVEVLGFNVPYNLTSSPTR